ncbi:type II toxin-antitoxin system VapC family toxin [Allobranchiibius sp. CTAmp26]|uniref:type II toxin-antitoxin system VapC family toxin n=1 Tax=Allobranchiibius sp. CTAmp26 TaxID=2815214 RepID=UPI001AA0E0F6|nr:type II toxin-antitoxin system VapC family toxin [Allobranchiibius sp. CTAmp26]MBO1756758.1 type II toxin-antitoxin system VapC family toxin [Allobranchiibius sp. CTAmp26]
MVVVDAATVVDALTAVAGTDDLRAHLATEDLHAPHLIDVELVSALRGLRLGGHLSASRAIDLLTDFDDLPIQRWKPTPGMRRRVFQLRDNLSAYDAAYVVLAEALECPLLTRNAGLQRSSGHDVQIEVR